MHLFKSKFMLIICRARNIKCQLAPIYVYVMWKITHKYTLPVCVCVCMYAGKRLLYELKGSTFGFIPFIHSNGRAEKVLLFNVAVRRRCYWTGCDVCFTRAEKLRPFVCFMLFCFRKLSYSLSSSVYWQPGVCVLCRQVCKRFSWPIFTSIFHFHSCAKWALRQGKEKHLSSWIA